LVLEYWFCLVGCIYSVAEYRNLLILLMNNNSLLIRFLIV
jgi:hypothetical protein